MCFWAPLADAGWRKPLDGHTVTTSDEAAREFGPEDRAGVGALLGPVVVAPDATRTATLARRAGFGGAPLPVRCRRARVDANADAWRSSPQRIVGQERLVMPRGRFRSAVRWLRKPAGRARPTRRAQRTQRFRAPQGRRGCRNLIRVCCVLSCESLESNPRPPHEVPQLFTELRVLCVLTLCAVCSTLGSRRLHRWRLHLVL